MAIQQLAWAVPRPVTVWIPNEREGQILGGVPSHADATTEACKTLRTHARRQGLDWLVRQENDLRYVRATYTRPRDRIGTLYPDCLVAIGVHMPFDDPYDLTLIATPPVLVIEFISRRTRRKDYGSKVEAYAQMGILEYVTFDPRPRKKLELHGRRLVGPGRYQEIPHAPEGGLWLSSIDLRVVGEPPPGPYEGARLRFYTRTGERLLHTDEEAALRLAERERRAQAEEEAQGEREGRQRAEARVARLQALLAEHGIADDDPG
jgi:Uma2 family endonuclease